MSGCYERTRRGNAEKKAGIKEELVAAHSKRIV